MRVRHGFAGAAALLAAAACAGGGDGAADAGPDGGASYEPDEAFWAPVGAESLTFEFEGRLNDQATDYDDLKQGRGAFTAALASGATAMEEGQLGWLGQFPEECSQPALCGRPYVVMSAYRTLESGASGMTAIHVNVYAMADAIEAALAAGDRELPFGDGLAYLHEWRVDVKPDGTRLDRICTLAIRAGDAASRLFVGGEAPALGVGEPLHLYGNVALGTDAGAIAASDPDLVEYGGLLCELRVDDAPATAEEYEAALAEDGPQLSCELPEGYLEPPAADYVTVTFEGEINAADAEYLTYGSAEFGAGVGGEPVGDALYSVYATRTGASSGGTDYVAVTALDDVESDGAGGYAFGVIGVEALTDALVEAKEAGAPEIPADALFVYVADADQYYASSTGVYTRLCPIAVSDPASTASSLYVCLDASEAFGVGEELELAGSVVLSTDPSVVAGASGLPDGETCFCSLNEEAIPCDEYP